MRRKPNDRLIQARIARGWSHEDVAKKTGITAKRVQGIENGSAYASPAERQLFCSTFELDLDTLGLLKESKKRASERKAFLHDKMVSASKADKVLSAADGGANIMNIPNRKGGRARKSRRG